MKATIRLLKAVPLTTKNPDERLDAFEVYRKTLPKGFIFAPEVLDFWGGDIDSLIKVVEAECGLDPNRLNKAFHKSFGKVQAAPMEQLFIEQMIHYVTTYGAEFWGAYDADRVYIPTERLDVPAIDVESFDFVVIRGLTREEIKTAVMDLLRSGVALSEQSVSDVLTIAGDLFHLTYEEVEEVRNREVKIGLYDAYGMVPSSPTEFLRYLVFKTTGSALVIKSPGAIAAIKQGVADNNLLPIFERYDKFASVDRLGEIFLRYKPLFLAMRADKALRPTINRIRRAAERNHKPLAEDYLNGVTAAIKTGKRFDIERLDRELDGASVFRKVRLANALALRADPTLDSIVYKIRNGKSYATDFTPAGVAEASRAYTTVMVSIAAGLNVRGKKVYIPRGLVYGLPATEKQFTGNLPAGTSVHVPVGEALTAGVYWEDQGRNRIDLDLSVSNLDGKIGWDGAYRNQARSVLFSGDNTSAPNGASEVFWFDPAARGSWLMDLNYFNFNSSVPVPAKIIIGTADASDIRSDFVFNPNRLLAAAPTTISEKQTNLGLVVADPAGGHRFYFSLSETGGGITSRYSAHAEQARKFMMASLLRAPNLNEVLVYGGAVFVDDPADADEGFNLSPQAIDKTTILSILSS